MSKDRPMPGVIIIRHPRGQRDQLKRAIQDMVQSVKPKKQVLQEAWRAKDKTAKLVAALNSLNDSQIGFTANQQLESGYVLICRNGAVWLATQIGVFVKLIGIKQLIALSWRYKSLPNKAIQLWFLEASNGEQLGDDYALTYPANYLPLQKTAKLRRAICSQAKIDNIILQAERLPPSAVEILLQEAES